MKKYVTFVKDSEESRQVQEALFKAGFAWSSGKQYVKDQYIFFLLINNTLSGIISHTSNDFSRVADHLKAGYKEISPEAIIHYPFQLDGAKQPEKMIPVGDKEYSESRLIELTEAALKLEGGS